jgi:hypothetical protein
LDPEGREVSFRLDRPSDVSEKTLAPAKFRVFVEDQRTRVELVTGTREPLSAVTLDMPVDDVVKRASVEGRRGEDPWRTLGADAPLSLRADARQTRVTFAPGAFDELRVVLDDRKSDPRPVRGAVLSRPASSARELISVDLSPVRREESTGETRLVYALPGRNAWIYDLRLTVPDAVFRRRVRVTVPILREPGAEESAERFLAEVDLQRGPGMERLSVPVGAPADSAEIVLTIDNGDSPPVGDVQVVARLAPTVLRFAAESSGAHRLLFGNAQATAPRYDIARLAGLPEARAAVATAGRSLPRASYRALEPAPLLPSVGAVFNAEGWVRRAAVTCEESGIQRLELTPAVLSSAQADGRDLRLVRDGHQVPYLIDGAGPRRDLDAPLEALPSPRPGVSRWRIALPYDRLPLQRLTVSCRDRLFDREVRVVEEWSDELGERREVGLGQSRWTRSSARTDGRLAVSLLAPRKNALILEVQDGDNPPLSLENARVTYRTQRLYFKVAEPGTLDLVFGNPDAAAPRYDIALVAGEVMAADKVDARLAEPAPVKRHRGLALESNAGRALFWGALALVVVGLLAVIAKMLPENGKKL